MPLTPQEFSQKYNTPIAITEKAFDRMSKKEAALMSISGKIGAGKDTSGPRLALRVLTHGDGQIRHEFFARAVRFEVQQIIDLIQKSQSKEDAVAKIEEQMNVIDGSSIADVLYDDVKTGLVLDAFSARTLSSRRANQVWGTEYRRSQDENYWVKKTMNDCIITLANGSNVLITDARFPNECDSIKDLGGALVRLDVSDEEQARRILARDGHIPPPESVSHPSELSLEGYSRFDLRVDTDGKTIEEVVFEAEQYMLSEGLV